MDPKLARECTASNSNTSQFKSMWHLWVFIHSLTRVQTNLKISNLLVCIYRCIYELETNIMGKPFKDLFFKKYFISPGSDVLWKFIVLNNDNQYSKSVACDTTNFLIIFWILRRVWNSVIFYKLTGVVFTQLCLLVKTYHENQNKSATMMSTF